MSVKDKYLFLRKEFPEKSATEAIADARWWQSWFAALRRKKGHLTEHGEIHEKSDDSNI